MSPWGRHAHETDTPGAQPADPSSRSPVKTLAALVVRRSSALFAATPLPLLNLPVILTTPDTDFGGVLFTMSIYVLVALGLNIVVGYAGLLDLGYVGFYAVGAYTVGMLTSQAGVLAVAAALPVAVAVAMVSGVLLGAPTLRVRGDYLAIVTLGFGEIIRLIAINSDWLGAARAKVASPSIPNPPPEPSSPVRDPAPGLGDRRPAASTSTTPRSSSSSGCSTRCRTTGWR